jgi:hypothetical protein
MAAFLFSLYLSWLLKNDRNKHYSNLGKNAIRKCDRLWPYPDLRSLTLNCPFHLFFDIGKTFATMIIRLRELETVFVCGVRNFVFRDGR